MKFTVGQIAHLVDGKVEGDPTLPISAVAKIEEGAPGCISFLANLKYEPYLYTTGSSAVLVDTQFRPKEPLSTTLIRVESAYLAFTKLLEEYQKLQATGRVGIEEPSYLAEGSQVGTGVYRGAFSYIGKGCTIGDGVKIYPNVTIGDNVTIGSGTVLHSGVRIHNNAVIGRQVVIFHNAVIGSDGFGFAPQPDGSYRTIPQLGNVVIEDHVSIGANTTVDCATMGSTRIGEGTKIDNLVQIAHNVEIGKHTVIAAHTGISGSTKIGDYCVIAGQVGIAGHLTVANRTKLGAQAGVMRSIKEEGTALVGSPALPLMDSLRSFAVFPKLPELEKRLLQLEKKLSTNQNGA